MNILITGFDAFGNEKINPAFEAIKMIKDEINGFKIIKAQLPTIFGKSVEKLLYYIEKEKPELVICVGQAGGRFNISPEVVAINKDDALIPDNNGNQPLDQKIMLDGDTAYFTGLPYKRIVKKLRESGIPSEASFTAGTYVCNHVFYSLMYYINKKYKNIRGGFVHVPFSTEQVLDKKDYPFMSLEMISRALEIVILTSAEFYDDISLVVGDIK